MKEQVLDDFDYKEDDFEFFRDFFVLDQAEFVVNLLKSATIPYKLEKSQTVIDEAIVGNTLTPKFVLRLPPVFFEKANDLIRSNTQISDAYLEEHYLDQLDENELIEILEKPDEWSIEDGLVAQRILANRGKEISEEEIQQMQEERRTLLRTGRSESRGKILSFYLLSLAVSFFFSAFYVLAGLGLSWYYWKDTNVDATGYKYFSFDESTRKFGQNMFWFWLVIVIPFFFFLLPATLIWLGDVYYFNG